MLDAPPLLQTCQFFCEYCAVANVRGASTPRHVARTRRFSVDGVVIAAGSMLPAERPLHWSVRLLMNVPCRVWPGASVPVSLPS